MQLLVTGSSSFELQDKLSEPLTGRKFEYHLYPISTAKLLNAQGLLGVKQSLENRLIFGSYPDIINRKDDAKELLRNLSDSYLYKDLLSLESVRRPMLLGKLLTALALQVTSEVSYNELAQTVGTDNKTGRYANCLFWADQPATGDRLHRGERRPDFALRGEMESEAHQHPVYLRLPLHLRCQGESDRHARELDGMGVAPRHTSGTRLAICKTEKMSFCLPLPA